MFPSLLDLFCICKFYCPSRSLCHPIGNVPLILQFSEEILVFPLLLFFLYFYALFIAKGLLVFPGYFFGSTEVSLDVPFLSPLLFASLLSSLIYKPPQITTLPSCFSFLWDGLLNSSPYLQVSIPLVLRHTYFY